MRSVSDGFWHCLSEGPSFHYNLIMIYSVHSDEVFVKYMCLLIACMTNYLSLWLCISWHIRCSILFWLLMTYSTLSIHCAMLLMTIYEVFIHYSVFFWWLFYRKLFITVSCYSFSDFYYIHSHCIILLMVMTFLTVVEVTVSWKHSDAFLIFLVTILTVDYIPWPMGYDTITLTHSVSCYIDSVTMGDAFFWCSILGDALESRWCSFITFITWKLTILHSGHFYWRVYWLTYSDILMVSMTIIIIPTFYSVSILSDIIQMIPLECSIVFIVIPSRVYVCSDGRLCGSWLCAVISYYTMTTDIWLMPLLTLFWYSA